VILTTTTQKLQVFFAGAKATNDCPVNVDFVDFTTTTTTPGMSSVNTNGVATVDILAAPAASTQRKINGVTLYNADTAAVVVTIQINDNATLYPVVSAMTIPVGASLQYTDRRGWSVVTQTGGVKTLKTGLQQEFNANGTWVKPGSARFVMVEAIGGGGGGGAGGGGGTNAGGGGGGGKRSQWLFLAKDLSASVSVTVGAPTSAASVVTGSVGNVSSFGAYLYGYGGGGGAYINSITYGGGGGGGGGTAAGSSGSNATSGVGGAAFLAGGAANTATATHAGGGGKAGSFLGGGGGGDGATASAGGYSWFSAGGGGGAGSTTPGAGGGSGSTLSGPATGSGLTDIRGCGTGGAGAPSPGPGNRGGFPGGGGGGGGGGQGGTGTGGLGGIGASGAVRVWCW